MRSFPMAMADGVMSVIVMMNGRGDVVRYHSASGQDLTGPYLDNDGVRGSARDDDGAAPSSSTLTERRRLHALFDQSPFSTQIFSPDGRTIAVNKAWQNLWRSTSEAAAGYNILLDPQLIEKGVMPYILRGFGGEPTAIPAIEYDTQQQVKTLGFKRWVRAFIYPVFEEKRLIEVILMHEDVTGQKQAESALLDAHEKLERRVQDRTAELAREVSERVRAERLLFTEKERAEVTLRSIGDGVITTDPAGSVVSMNAVAETLTAWREWDARGRALSDVFQVIDEDTRQSIKDPVEACLRRDGAVRAENTPLLLLNRQGDECPIEGSAAPIRGRDGEKLGAVIVFRDVTQQRLLNKEMAYHAQHDALTGLVNRREFERRLAQALSSSRDYGWQHALCFLDLDRFKIVNDTAGHMAGDELLRQITALLLDGVRERDTLARLGGDEFGLLLHNCPLEKAWQIAESLMTQVRDFNFLWKGRSFQIGTSIGIVPITAEASDAARLLGRADQACYIAKDMGRDRVFVCPVDEQEPLRRPANVFQLDELRSALGEGRLRLYCQPIVSLQHEEAGPPAFFEMLLRLIDVQGNVLLPGAFIPAAERHGVMRKFDRWVINATLCGFKESALLPGQARISINLSAHSLGDETLPDFIAARLESCGLQARQVCFEIAETAVAQHFTRASRFIDAVRGLGCRIALDEFGGGLSSFSYLKKLTVDYVKISGQLIANMVEDELDQAMVAAARQVAVAAGCRTVAKHVDTPVHLERARQLGLDYAQGFVVAAPRPLMEFV